MDAIGHFRNKYGRLPFDGDEELIAALQAAQEVGAPVRSLLSLHPLPYPTLASRHLPHYVHHRVGTELPPTSPDLTPPPHTTPHPPT